MAEPPQLLSPASKFNGPRCDDDDCPTVYSTDRGTFAVQSDHFTALKAPIGSPPSRFPDTF